MPLYRDQKCGSVDLSSGTLDENGVSGLIGCLNRENQLDKISETWNGLSSQDQKLIARIIDREFIRDSKFRTDFLNSNSRIKADSSSKNEISKFLKLWANSEVLKSIKTVVSHSQKIIKKLFNSATREAPVVMAQVAIQILGSNWSKTFFDKIKNRSAKTTSEALKEYWSYFKNPHKEKSLIAARQSVC